MNSSARQGLAGKSAMLVSNNDFDCMFVEELLGQVEMSLTQADSLAVATGVLQQRRFDVLLLDLRHLEEGSVQSLFRRGELVNPGGRTIGIGDRDTQGLCDALVPKPIEPEVFYQALLTSPRPPAPAADAPSRPFPTSELISFREGLMRLGGNHEAYERVLALFIDNQRHVPEAIAQALGDGNVESARHLAHTIKGVAGNVGAMGIHEAALPLEEAIKQGDLDAARHLLRELEKRFTKVKALIEQWLNRQDEPPQNPTASGPFDGREAGESLRRLLEPLDLRRPVECHARLADVRLQPWPAAMVERINELNRLARGYRYRQAQALVSELLGQLEQEEA